MTTPAQAFAELGAFVVKAMMPGARVLLGIEPATE